MVVKAALTTEIALSIGATRKEARAILDAILDGLVKALRNGERVELRGFGAFRVHARGSRVAFNPKAGAMKVVPARKVVHFHPGRELLALLNGSAAVAVPAAGRKRAGSAG